MTTDGCIKMPILAIRLAKVGAGAANGRGGELSWNWKSMEGFVRVEDMSSESNPIRETSRSRVRVLKIEPDLKAGEVLTGFEDLCFFFTQLGLED